MEMKGRFVLSDDSHGVGHIGTNYCKALEFIRETGIRELYYFAKGSGEGDGRLNDTVMHCVSLAEVERHGFWQSIK